MEAVKEEAENRKKNKEKNEKKKKLKMHVMTVGNVLP